MYIYILHVDQIWDMKFCFITLIHEKQTLLTFVNSLLIFEQNDKEKRGE